jgi:hypothetical protein
MILTITQLQWRHRIVRTPMQANTTPSCARQSPKLWIFGSPATSCLAIVSIMAAHPNRSVPVVPQAFGTPTGFRTSDNLCIFAGSRAADLMQVILVPKLVAETCMVLNDTLTRSEADNCTHIATRAYSPFYESPAQVCRLLDPRSVLTSSGLRCRSQHPGHGPDRH